MRINNFNYFFSFFSSKNIINLFLYDGTNTYVIAETIIPARSTLVLTDNLSYDNRVFDLKFYEEELKNDAKYVEEIIIEEELKNQIISE